MTAYLYTTKDGETVERCFPMGKARSYVRLKDGRRAKRDIVAEQSQSCPIHTGAAKWPFFSEAAGVHPHQVQEATEFCKKSGVPTAFDPATGCPEMKSPKHRRRFNKAWGYHDKSGYD